MEDKRFVYPNVTAIEQFRKEKGWSHGDLAREAKVSKDTVKRAEQGERKQLGKMAQMAGALGKEVTQIVRGLCPEPVADKSYTWNDLAVGAKKVGEEIFIGNKRLVDAVLTFPGPSSIFCGLVLATLPLPVFMRMAVYTAIFVDAKTPTSRRLRYFDVIRTESFKILIPRELIEDKTKRIVVIDDAIITGGTMDKMWEFFAKKYDPEKVKFACCICYAGRTLPTEKPPEIIGLPLEQRMTFPMPWGRDAFCFEDAFFNGTRSGKNTGRSMPKSK